MEEHKLEGKALARHRAYQGLKEAKAARFPFPIEGRIPNFKGAEAAARLLQTLPAYQRANALKVNPDAPQLPVRAMALADGKTVYLPSPRLRGAFLKLSPDRIPEGETRRAASLSHCAKYGQELDLAEFAAELKKRPVDLVVAGSVAVTRQGARAGKGEGYSDLEYALLQELGLPHVPTVTTVHTAQIVEDLPVEPYDLSLDYIITPHEIIETNNPYPKPKGIAWDRLSPEDLEAMPLLAELRELTWEKHSTPDLLKPGLHILFVGLNPGRKSAAQGHNFAGPGNHFWRLLHESGLTPDRLRPEEEEKLLQYGLGITNIVSRASRGEADLTWQELVEGGTKLKETVRTYAPRVVTFLGKNVYRAYAGLKRSSDVPWGLQASQTVPGTIEFVAPNPSARSTIPYQKRLDLFTAVKEVAFRSPDV